MNAKASLPAVPVWVKSCFSFLEGASHPRELVEEAHRLGYPAVALTDRDGRFARYKIVDPSFHNWFGLALALRGEQISDFPLCNKSFNLSYCGHDL